MQLSVISELGATFNWKFVDEYYDPISNNILISSFVFVKDFFLELRVHFLQFTTILQVHISRRGQQKLQILFQEVTNFEISAT